ncbi:biotin transporter BioY [Ectobacillus ponti]|uniref:Biotin transporter n=1 Tax=Ectobacillus ponti TaxID=2961894 RepID=A0AA41X7G5_9BACI|nr:biotin transporter BioY [Ectobacillus ponti]MCP8967688.1 biotin transporter BioY [Ectobacillus ponti]
MKLKDMMYVSLFAAVTAALGLLPPLTLSFTPVPITAQTLGVMLAGAVLGARRGFMSLLIFDLLVAAGAPLLSGGRGGFSVILGPSGGYILSWPIAALIIGYLVEKSWRSLRMWNMVAIQILGGIIFVYACGVTYTAMVLKTPWLANATASLIFIPGDLTKVVISSLVALQIKRIYPLIRQETEQKAA